MLSSEFVTYLESVLPGVDIYNGAIDKNNDTCLGVFVRGSSEPNIALGGIDNTTYGLLPLSILVHWTENTDECQTMANSVYIKVRGKVDIMMGTKRVMFVNMLDSAPTNITRDENNICEMVIRLAITYER